jgi:hypothetical protein
MHEYIPKYIPKESFKKIQIIDSKGQVICFKISLKNDNHRQQIFMSLFPIQTSNLINEPFGHLGLIYIQIFDNHWINECCF